MNKKTKKLIGKEQAKLNTRKKFYKKLERFYDKLQVGEENIIFLSMNKNYSFPEFNELSKFLNNNYIELDQEIKIENSNSLEIKFYEEAKFIIEASKSKFIYICRRETKLNNEGKLRKGLTSSKDDYNYQIAFNWAIKLENNEKFAETLAIEKLNPTEYDLTPDKAVILEPIHYKSKGQRKRKRR